MSDSEDDFASADEGETTETKPTKAKEEEPKESVKENQVAKSQETSKPPKSKKETATVATQSKDLQQDKKGGKGHAKGSGDSKKVQEASSSSGGKGKQSGNQKKGKQKGGKKPGKDVSVEDKPDKCETHASKTEHEEKEKDNAENKNEEKEATKEDVVNTDSKNASSEEIKSFESEEEPIKDTTSESVKTEEPSTPIKSKDDKEDSADLIQSPSTQCIPRQGPDHTQEQENVLTKLAEAAQEKKQSGWGWGWGSSLLNVASNSVSTFTSQVGEGFNTMIETVESTLNVPSPEDLVKSKSEEEGIDHEAEETGKQETKSAEGGSTEKSKDAEKSNEESQSEKPGEPSEADSQSPQEDSNSWFSSWGVGNITKMVESTGKTLVTGSLDVLETLGKKTFDALNEHDPGLKKTRGLLKERGDKPNLSAMLRDARDQHEARVKLEKESEEARKAHFGTLFDDFQGLAHLEALEILSNQSEKKLSSLLTAIPPEVMTALKPQLLEIKANFEIGEEEEEDVDEHNFEELISGVYSQLNIGTSPDKLTRVQSQIRDSIGNFGEKSSSEDKPALKEIHLVAIRSLAEFTSKSIEQFHKAGEMVLLYKTQNSDFVSSSKQLQSLTKVLCTEIGILSTKFTECLNSNSGADESVNINQLVTSVYLEASNSSSYIQDGFQLLLPVIQQAAIEKNQEPSS